MNGVINAGSNPNLYTPDYVGGKGLNLLRLYDLAQETRRFDVPNFFIIPTDATKQIVTSGQTPRVIYDDPHIRAAFDSLEKPVAIRSSSPQEDGEKASFAGMFQSVLGVQNHPEFEVAASRVYQSVNDERVGRYASRVSVELSDRMAIIVQQQVMDALEWGVIQLEEKKAITEMNHYGHKSEHEISYSFLDRDIKNWTPNFDGGANHDYLSEGEHYYAVQCARKIKQTLGLDGIIQLEVLLSPGKKPQFVQVRKLPDINSHALELDLDVPKGTPYLESHLCNGIAGEITLPAYVTLSQSGIRSLLIRTGQTSLIPRLGKGQGVDERSERFYRESNLAKNFDFQTFKSLVMKERHSDLDELLSEYAQSWKRGNNLFPKYILVCDKLDETICAMADVTTGKKAIITCNEASRTSHAMTVARDLGIMCMGVRESIDKLEPKFFHQVETGDLIHIKSDGTRAITFIEKKRESNPYQD